jgi:hypothetical protein
LTAPDDAHDYKKSLTNLAKNQKTLADKLYAGQDPEEYATAEWLNEDKEGLFPEATSTTR